MAGIGKNQGITDNMATIEKATLLPNRFVSAVF